MANGKVSLGFQHCSGRLEECVTVAMAFDTIESFRIHVLGIELEGYGILFRHSHGVAGPAQSQSQLQSQEARNLDGDRLQFCDAAFCCWSLSG
jgi:hypothetical protein